MDVIRNVRQMQDAAAVVKRSGRRTALVPTMGALHEGHVALIRAAHAKGAAVAVSIFVNPAQFAPHEDFKRYPRPFEADTALCEREGVAVVFAPAAEDVYALNASTWVEETIVANRLEGERRPQFFRGVCTVVAKLFAILQPDVAVFGMKDYQQLKVVQRLARDLCFGVEIVPVPTVREADGLALSSRNQYLDESERAQATVIFKALRVAQSMFNAGENNAQRLATAMMRTVEIAPAARLDYAELAGGETLEPITEVKRGDVALIAAYLGKTRLIDNLVL